MSQNTPWGFAQHTKKYADGIVSYSTAGHGGFRLDAERQAIVDSRLPAFKSFAGRQWYEEDQDWAIVAIMFPECFEPHELRNAVSTVRGSAESERNRGSSRGWIEAQAWLESASGSQIMAIVAKWNNDNAANWTIASLGSPPKGYGYNCWSVGLRRVCDSKYQNVVLTDYPESLLTDADIERLTAVKPELATV
jgi:hypothetical protein